MRFVVEATHGKWQFRYPPSARSQVEEWWRLNPRGDLHEATRIVERLRGLLSATLKRGHDVLVHCEQSFHRGPVVGAALYRSVTGQSARVEGFREKLGGGRGQEERSREEWKWGRGRGAEGVRKRAG